MLFTKKTTGFFVEISDHSISIAKTSSASAPLVVEDIRSFGAADGDAFSAAMKELQPKRGGAGGFFRATVGVYSPKSLVRRAPVETKRGRDEAHLSEIVSSQFRIEANDYTIAVLSPSTGFDFDRDNTTEKEALFAGLPNSEIISVQQHLLSKGVYPERLELGTVATLGGLVDYLSFAKLDAPTLLLEINSDTTQSFIVGPGGVATARSIPQGIDSMIPVVQKELGLKDEESSRRLFYSNTFDFTGMASALTKKLIKELQSSIGFYEVQTGQSIGQVICSLLPEKLSWLERTIANQLGVELLKIDYIPWLKERKITIQDPNSLTAGGNRHLGLLSLLIKHPHAVPPEQKSK